MRLHNSKGLAEQMDYYPEHPEHQEYLSSQEQKEIHENHTCEHRIDEMLGLIKKRQIQKDA